MNKTKLIVSSWYEVPNNDSLNVKFFIITQYKEYSGNS